VMLQEKKDQEEVKKDDRFQIKYLRLNIDSLC
jgi:hypothetical protein